MELWTMRIPTPVGLDEQARKVEAAGWDGMGVTDSQNLCADPFVCLALAARATERLRLGTGVTNAFTRHPAALATAASTVQEASGGRFVLGIGRGDTALFHLGHKPMKVDDFAEATTRLQTYLAGGSIPLEAGFGPGESRIRWLAANRSPKVPLDVAVSGPRMITFAAGLAESVTFALGADVDRLQWGIDLARTAAAEAGRDPSELRFGAYLNVGCHPDRDVARSMVRGSVAAFAHFSSMPGSTGAGLAEQDRAVVAEVGRRYDSTEHLRNDAGHTEALDAGFIDRFGVIGGPDEVTDRLLAIESLGVERAVLTGPGMGTDRDDARLANRLVTDEVLPALQAS